MLNLFKVELKTLGFLRLSLFILAITNTLMSLFEIMLRSPASAETDDSVWTVYVTVISPVLAIIFIVVIFLDFVMSKVRASDLEGDSRLQFLTISRLEMLIIVIMLAYWVPFFVAL